MARKKQTIKAKEPIRIRFKKLANGNQSIYLDIYQDGKREYEFLKLYLIPETTPFDKRQNDECLKLANAIKAQRIIDLSNSKAGIKSSIKGNMLLSDWMEQYGQNKSKSTAVTINDCSKLLTSLCNGKDIRLKDVDKKFCMEFINFLKYEYVSPHGNKLKPTSAKIYLTIFSGALNRAVRQDVIGINPFSKIDSSDRIKATSTQRSYLTEEELVQMMKTDCINKNVKQAFLFSCFCGLRISDIRNLKWGNVVTDGEETRLEIIVQKTQKTLGVPLSDVAKHYLPVRGNNGNDQNVFDLPSSPAIRYDIRKWAKNAGISKSISFHTARHTFATQSLTEDVPVVVIQNILGHSNVKTTQIYAEIINKKKIEGVNALNKFQKYQSEE